jgi:hypothetical protein
LAEKANSLATPGKPPSRRTSPPVVDAKALIRDFKISPELPPAEAAYMERFAHERLGVPLKPPPTDETPSFLQPLFKNEQDDFRDVFTGLDQASIS